MAKIVVLEDGETWGAVEGALIIDVPDHLTDAEDIENYIREEGWEMGEELGVLLKEHDDS